MQAPSPFLAAENLACRRGERLLFRKFAFRLESGAACHVMGANGAGKTTLLRALAGLTTPYAGSVTRGGALGLLDERTGLDPDLPLGKALDFWERIDGCTRPEGTITILGLAPLLEVPVRFLSTGQKKRAALAALLNRAVPIWLLDEPLSGLDAETIAKVTALIRLHVGGGGIALIASHQPLDVPGMTSFAIEDYAPAPEEDYA
ncbi:MAG: heme ABC exporter ATP-binding protein CcmA [Erythrobacter sp.]|nr:heme ABC exporter ATP-binding protein CcmA [Erythrobacter sp.]MBA4080944.1 heme ABC exporter ATP-binding protein CcmA [Erythrobacter sp.]